ncbi:MAG: hypothetical protein C4345_15585, partial [Chloroflexota bacterium]
RHLELDSFLGPTLEMILHLVGLPTGWVLLKKEGGGFFLAAAHGLPPGMEEDIWGPCTCQRMLLEGKLKTGVNVVTCERLARLEPGEQGGLEYHASVPLRSGDEVLGILNLAKPGPEPLNARTLDLLTRMGEILGTAVHRAQLFEAVRRDRLEEQRTLVQLAFALLQAQSEEEVAQRVVAALIHRVLSSGVGGVVSPEPRSEPAPFGVSLPEVASRSEHQVASRSEHRVASRSEHREELHLAKTPPLDVTSQSERVEGQIAGIGFLYAVSTLGEHQAASRRIHLEERELAWAGARPGGASGLDAARISLGERGTLVLVGAAQRLNRDFLELVQGLATTAMARLEAERRAVHQAYHDPLTGLANRRALLERLEYLVQRVRRGKGRRSGGLILLDLNDFKEVNDVYGNLTGDRVLEEVARRLEGAVRPGDLVARLGGDEFAVLLFDLGQAGVRPAASRCSPFGEAARSKHRAEVLSQVGERLCERLEAPISIQGKPHRLTASLGLVVVDGSLGAEEILRRADLAMYWAKGVPGRRMAFFDTILEAELTERLELEQALRTAVAGGFQGFRVVYQPVVDLATGKWCALEALLRFTAPRVGPISPARFIPLAEELGLIEALGEFVLRKALAVSKRTGYRVSVNVSPLELFPGYPERVARCLKEMGVGPDRLFLEVTEGALYREGAEEVLSRLAELGVGVWLDDFGSGYSSLEKLALLPLKGFKISSDFTARLGPNPDPGSPLARMFRGLLILGTFLELQAIVEGVETPEQHDHLLSQGFTRGQGYLFLPPMEEGEINVCKP